MQQDVAPRRAAGKVMPALIALAVALIVVPTGVYAQTNTVKVKGEVKMADSTGDNVESESFATVGILGAEGAPDGALKVQNFAGGGGLLGTGDCDDVAPPNSRPNSVTVESNADRIVTAILVTGANVSVAVTAPDLNELIGPFPVANIATTTENPNAFIGLGNGLTVSPSELVFTCTGGAGNFVILGQ